MPRANDSLMRVAGICLPLILIAVAARTALKPKSAVASVSGLPAVEEIDSLGKYLRPQQNLVVPVVASGAIVRDAEADSYERVSRVQRQSVPRENPAVDSYQVTAILISSDRRVAVVNETLVSVGSMLPGGAKILAIENDYVEIFVDGKRRLLSIKESSGQ
jgi:hypothetical protein